MSSFSSWVLQFTPQLEGSGWPCSSCGFSSLSEASRGHSDPQTSAASCSSTPLTRMCCSHSPQSAPSACSQHRTLSEKTASIMFQCYNPDVWGLDKTPIIFLCKCIVVAHGTLFIHYSFINIVCFALCACAETRVHFGNCTRLLAVHVRALAWLWFKVDPAVREVKIRTALWQGQRNLTLSLSLENPDWPLTRILTAPYSSPFLLIAR